MLIGKCNTELLQNYKEWAPEQFETCVKNFVVAIVKFIAKKLGKTDFVNKHSIQDLADFAGPLTDEQVEQADIPSRYRVTINRLPEVSPGSGFVCRLFLSFFVLFPFLFLPKNQKKKENPNTLPPVLTHSLTRYLN